MRSRLSPALLLSLLPHPLPAVTPGGAAEPVRYSGAAVVERDRHDGGLPLVAGVHSFQILRANRTNLEEGNRKGWTYNHAPNMAFWKGRFYVEAVTQPVNEADWPPRDQGNRILTLSTNGRDWSKPVDTFPHVPVVSLPGVEGKHSETISRSSFYITTGDRLLLTTSLGTSSNRAVGRLVREVFDTVPPTFGPLHFIRYYHGFSAENTAATGVPQYAKSADGGFKAACDELLSRDLVTENWWEDELNSQREEGPLRPTDSFYQVPYRNGQLDDNLVKAMWTFQRPDGNWLAGWKGGVFAIRDRESKRWSPPVFARTIVNAGAKTWGQKMPDGRFASVYNPVSDNFHRWPLAMLTSDDAIVFDGLATIFGDVPPQRYKGGNKEAGPQYARGIEPWNGTPADDGMWLAHSINKEDLWITRVPPKAGTKVSGDVRDDFEGVSPDAVVVPGWNLYRPLWAPVDVVDFDGGRRLRMQDREPYDHAKCVRVFSEGTKVTASLRVRPSQGDGQLEIDLLTPQGRRPVRVVFGNDGRLNVSHGGQVESPGTYPAGQWITVEITADCATGTHAVKAGDLSVAGRGFAEPASSLTRLEFRTGAARTGPLASGHPYIPADLPESELPSKSHEFYLDDVVIKSDGTAPVPAVAQGVIADTPPREHLRLWLRADTGITADASGHVGEWQDQSGSGNHLMNPAEDPASKPRLMPDRLHGKPVVHFDGSDHLSRDLPGLIADRAGVFIVFKASRPRDRWFLFDTAADSQLSRHEFSQTGDWLEFRVDRGGGGMNHGGVTAGAPALASFVMNGSASFSRINGAHHRVGGFSETGYPGFYSQIPTASGSPFVLGARHTRDRGFLEGDIAEMLIYDHAPDAVALRQVEAYLMGKYFPNGGAETPKEGAGLQPADAEPGSADRR